MNEHNCFGSTFPLRSVFAKIVSRDWYDGTTAGVAQCARCQTCFKYDIIDWDSDQERRIFALSPIEVREFESIVQLLSESDSPTWPFWSPKWWQLTSPEKERITEEMDRCLARAKSPEFLLASDWKLETIFAAKRLTGSTRYRLPPVFDGLPANNDFSYWAECVGLHT